MNQANDFYRSAGLDIMEKGLLVNTRGTESKELICPLFVFDLNEPQVVTSATRKLKPSYVIEEFKWYMSGSLDAANISHAAPFWDSLKDKNGEVVSNYGYWIFHEEAFRDDNGESFSRFDNCLNILVTDPQSRKAIINIHGTDNSDINLKDTPCTLSLQFLIRENKLNMIVHMRSNDLVMGWCNDILQFQFIAWMMYAVLKHRFGFEDLQLGEYYHTAGSLHIYDRHFNKPEFQIDYEDEKMFSPSAAAFRFSLFQSLHRIKRHIPTQVNMSTIDWLNEYVVPLIINYNGGHPKENLPFDSDLIDAGAFPFDEGV